MVAEYVPYICNYLISSYSCAISLMENHCVMFSLGIPHLGFPAWDLPHTLQSACLAGKTCSSAVTVEISVESGILHHQYNFTNDDL